MSVINKMLRDLDQRQPAALPSSGDVAGAGRPSSTSRPRQSAAAPRRAVLWLAYAAVMGTALAGAAWWSGLLTPYTAPEIKLAPTTVPAPQHSATGLVQSDIAPPPAPLTATSAAQMTMPTPSVPTAPESANAVEALPAPTLAFSTSATVAAASSDTKPLPAPQAQRRESGTLGLRMDTTMRLRAGSESKTRPASAPATEAVRAPSANEALERAQALWNNGSQDAAIELLQDAVAVTQRNASSNLGQAHLLALVRELTRMQLALSRHSAVWDLLYRLEPQLGGASDLLAIRGHVAQRLGRHQDSVHAYLAALQIRPNEQRWMLGAAVSLAATGQTQSAADMAAKAHSIGSISADVQTYLRQMGVPVQEP
jgi:MSHA biogenesis protein MshN